jgi:hypothetical protein
MPMDHKPHALEHVSVAELETMITETDQTIQAVRDELVRRRQQRQHLEIERLEEHLAEAKPKWAEVKSFLELVLRELRK